MTVVDLCGGPGGWDVAARDLGIDPLGIEWDDAAVATRNSVGLRTLHTDVRLVHPAELGPVRGVIASMPCHDFSPAGKGEGRAKASELAAVAYARLTGKWDEETMRAEEILSEAVPRAFLILEPLRYIADLEPRWIAFENVPAVLPIFDAMAAGLDRRGYSTWAGLLNAETFGVPQTRTRAFLMASLDRKVTEPPATHKRYIAPKRDRTDMDHLFGDDTPERGRIVHPDDVGLLDWISMADGLGWDADFEVHQKRGAGMAARHGERRARRGDEPAPTVTGGGGRGGGPRWDLRPTHFDRRQVDGRGVPSALRAVTEPAPTITASVARSSGVWVFQRPATTIACDPRVQPPGHKINQADIGYDGRAGINAIRITPREAGILQSFPADYPWQGNKSDQHTQAGNAVPPLMAKAVLQAVIS